MKKRAWIMFFDESGVPLLPQVPRTYAPRGRTPTLRHRLNWKRASMAAAPGYHAADASTVRDGASTSSRAATTPPR
ncbi:transposase [Streptomyces malaysiensis]|uniref:Transposase n=1 Tax=Streptomyces malaysiensis subsp. samsunensis TaxID=459658 RepID=A0A9X2RUE9_STRMQ|nr:transposase [Streptomyces samsunensis]MCQ8829050.1 transposase [Streptomyces samsunensis]